MSDQNVEKVKQVRGFFENRDMYKNEVESFTIRYPLNERCLIARLNSITLKVEIFYAGQVMEKHKTTGNTRLQLVDVIDPNTGKTKNGHKNLSVLELMPNNVDKPWVYAYITFDNLNKLLNISTPLKRSTSSQSFFPTQQSLNTNKTKKRKAHPLSKNPEELIFPPDVFNEDDEDDNTSNEMPIIDEEPSPTSSKNGGKRKTKKRKAKKRKTLKKRKTTKKR